MSDPRERMTREYLAVSAAASDHPRGKHTHRNAWQQEISRISLLERNKISKSQAQLVLTQTEQGNKCVSFTPVPGLAPSCTTSQLLRSNKSFRNQSRRHGQKTISRNERNFKYLHTGISKSCQIKDWRGIAIIFLKENRILTFQLRKFPEILLSREGN